MNKVESKVLIGITTNDTFYSRLVSSLTGSRYSHTFIMYKSELWGGWWIVQVDDKGIRKVPADIYLKQYKSIEIYECAIDLENGVKAIRNYIGKKYDWLGIFGFWLKILWSKLFGVKILNPVNDEAKLFCSEMCMIILQTCDVPGTKYFDPSSTSPGMLYDFLEDSCYFRKVELPIELKGK